MISQHKKVHQLPAVEVSKQVREGPSAPGPAFPTVASSILAVQGHHLYADIKDRNMEVMLESYGNHVIFHLWVGDLRKS